MTEWQTILAVLIVTAGLTGRQWSVITIVACNFIATMELAADPINVAIVDAAAAALLLFCGRRGHIVAAIYGVMIMIYPAFQAMGFSHYTTYAIIDVLAIAQLVIAGRWDVGISRAMRLGRSRSTYLRRSLASRPELADSVGVSQTEGNQS